MDISSAQKISKCNILTLGRAQPIYTLQSKAINLTTKKKAHMYPHLEYSNPEAISRIKAIAAHDPAFLVGLTGQFAEAIKHNIVALFPNEIEELIADFRYVEIPPLASLPLDELASKLATHLTHEDMAEQIAEFTTIEAVSLVIALQLYYAYEHLNPGRPVTLQAYAPFFRVLGFERN
jgi:hypothetical protein